MCKTETDVLELVRALAQALQAHHLGLTTTEPFGQTYERDHRLINQAEDFLSESKQQNRELVVLEAIVNKCEFCNKAEGTHEIGSRWIGDPELEVSVSTCAQCLQELQLGHVLKDIYGWSWTLFEGKFIAEYLEPELEPEDVADVPF